jgi:hypothetical protein
MQPWSPSRTGTTETSVPRAERHGWWVPVAIVVLVMLLLATIVLGGWLVTH